MTFSPYPQLSLFTGKRDASQAEIETEEDDEVSQFLLTVVSLICFCLYFTIIS